MSETEAHEHELFPPRPGGLVDTARKAAADAERAAEAMAGVPDFAGARFDPVKVQLRVPEIASASTVVIAAAAGYNRVQRLVGEDGQRFRVTVMTLDQPVVLCFSRTAADDPRNAVNAAGLPAGGFVVPVNVPVTLETSAQVWAAASSATATRVSFVRQSFS